MKHMLENELRLFWEDAQDHWAAAELAKMPPLTLEDMAEIYEHLRRTGKLTWTTGMIR